MRRTVPGKPIYDIPAVPVCTGQELVDRLMEQIKPFAPALHLGHMATDAHRGGTWRLTTDRDAVLEAPVLVIAAGGAVSPKRPQSLASTAMKANRCFTRSAKWKNSGPVWLSPVAATRLWTGLLTGAAGQVANPDPPP